MRKSLVACLAVALVVVGGLTALVGPRHCPVNRAAFERIGKGMTRAEVHAILGGPAGDYRKRPPHPACYIYPEHSGWGWFAERWEGDEGMVELWFNPVDEKFVQGLFKGAAPYSPGLVDLARWRLRKLKAAWLP